MHELAGIEETRQRSVLVVDDDEIYLELLQQLLEQEAFNVYTAIDGNEVPMLLARNRPDIVLMDYELPGMNGLDATKRIKSDLLYQDIPVIMLTGHGDMPTVRKSMQAGAADFIIKPSNRETIIDKINAVLTR